MPTYFVSRHPGAVEWARRRGIVAEAVTHLDVNRLSPGDIVLGTLPVSLAADVCARGCRYFHLDLPLPIEMRGRELTAGDMERFGAQFNEYFVKGPIDVKKG